MPVQQMNCPRCGNPASEYSPNKWQRLSCQTKFVYEPPPERVIHEDRVIRQAEINVSAQDLLYECPKCGLRFSQIAAPSNKCRQCGANVCPTCFGVDDGEKEKRGSDHKLLCVSCSESVWAAYRDFLLEWGIGVGLGVLFVVLLVVCLFGSCRNDSDRSAGKYSGSARHEDQATSKSATPSGDSQPDSAQQAAQTTRGLTERRDAEIQSLLKQAGEALSNQDLAKAKRSYQQVVVKAGLLTPQYAEEVSQAREMLHWIDLTQNPEKRFTIKAVMKTGTNTGLTIYDSRDAVQFRVGIGESFDTYRLKSYDEERRSATVEDQQGTYNIFAG